MNRRFRIMWSLKILLFLACASRVSAYSTMNDYLDERLRQTKIEIAKLHFREDPPAETKTYNVKWDQVWQEDFDKERPIIANTVDKIVLIKGNRSVSFSLDATPFDQTVPQDIFSPSNSNSIKFVRSTGWKGMIYLLLCYGTGSCGMYSGRDYSQLRQRQIIQHKGCPMDASFFVSANRLYLVVAVNSGQFVVPSLIYHWRRTYMDVIAEVMTTAAVSVTTFKHHQSIIIIFAQNDGSEPGIGSMVYEFKDYTPYRIQFLPTSHPTSVHHYSHAGFNFILLVNEHRPSNLFCWDGHELLNWDQIVEIQAPSLVHVVNINDDTFFLVGLENCLRLYKFGNILDYTPLSILKLPVEETLVEIRIKIIESTVILVLIAVNKDKAYSVESWELHMDEIPSDRSTSETNALSADLEELIELLQKRKWVATQAEALKPYLLPAQENITILNPLVLRNIILESGTVDNIDVFVDEDIIAPGELTERLENLITKADEASALSRELLTRNNITSLNGDILVNGDAFIEHLRVDKLDARFINNFDMDIIGSRSSREEQESTKVNSLKGNDITVQHLKVESICGVPSHYWSLNNDTTGMEINLESDNVEIVDNIVHLHSNVSLTEWTVKMINGTDVNQLLSELFIMNENQRIKGNLTYTNVLQIQNLTIEMLNGVPWKDYMNKVTDQHFEKFKLSRIYVENLQADLINGVPVSQAARISMENIIDGEAKVAKLFVRDKLTVDAAFKFPEVQHYQVYNDVTIDGNLNIDTLDMDKYTKIVINGEKMNLSNVLNTFWTKSTDQIIEKDIAFENNLQIDYLNTTYFNGFSEEEFLYTTVMNVPENFQNLHFENVRANDMFFAHGENYSFFDIAPESITIREKLHLRQLHGNQLFSKVFNGLPMNDILKGKRPTVLPRSMHFCAIKARQVNVNALNFLFFNDESSSSLLQDSLNADGNLERKFLKTTGFQVENLHVQWINNVDMKKLELLRNLSIHDTKNLTILGDLVVKDDLQVDLIDNQPPMIYLENIDKQIIVIDGEMTFDELTVQNVTLKSVQGRDMDILFDSFLSRSREQVVPGQFSFYQVRTENIKAKFLNSQDTSELKWIDEPLFITGNVTFDDLFVKGDVVANILNDQTVEELYENMLNVPARNIKDLRVNGNVSWEIPSNSTTSLTYLFENAVDKISNQTILGDTVFQKDVSASTITGQLREMDEIEDLIADAVIDNGDVIEVTGLKIFKEDLVIDTLAVNGNIDIATINGIDIVEFNNSVVKRDLHEPITGSITFLEQVTATKILVNDEDHDVPFKGVVLMTDVLPPRVMFKDLEINDVYLKNLDGINFAEFLKDRITVDDDSEIFSDVEFIGNVDVIGDANVTRINGIDPFDLVLNGTEEPQVISGSKTFKDDVLVKGNIQTPFVNGVNISAEYSDGIQNDEDVEILGDMIFKSTVNVRKGVSASNKINGVKLHTMMDDLEEETRRSLQEFTQQEVHMEDSIMQSALISGKLKNIFSYLESEESLKIEAPNIKNVQIVYYAEVMRLNLYGEMSGSLCGLPENCSCPVQYVAELDEQNYHVSRSVGSTIMRNYHEPHSTFSVDVIVNSVSYSPECTTNNKEDKDVKIAWINSDRVDAKNVLATAKEASAAIRGFVKDAETFMIHGNTAFVVLAVYYDPLLATHNTTSVIYKIDFDHNALLLHQKLPTDGAWDVEVFTVNHSQIYALLGCFGKSEKSFLYKMDPITSKFMLLRTFSGKARNAKSLFEERDHFVVLDDFEINAVNIFLYDQKFDNFYNYQSLYHESRIVAVERFYADEVGQSDSFIIVATENDQFYIYEYMYAQKFQRKMHHRINNVQIMVPFYYMHKHYIYVGTSANSTILKIVKHGPH